MARVYTAALPSLVEGAFGGGGRHGMEECGRTCAPYTRLVVRGWATRVCTGANTRLVWPYRPCDPVPGSWDWHPCAACGALLSGL